MKKKSMKDTYLREVDDYTIGTIEEADCYITLKKVNHTNEPYIETHTGFNTCLIGNGYHILEYLTKNENYGVRVFLDEDNNVKLYYMDVVGDVGVEDGYPFYMDLYLDVTIEPALNNDVIVWDEDELVDALKENKVTSEQFAMAHKIKENLLTEINHNKNRFVNRDHSKTIEKIENLGNMKRLEL